MSETPVQKDENPKPEKRRVPTYRTHSGKIYEAIEYKNELTFLYWKNGKFATICPINIP